MTYTYDNTDLSTDLAKVRSTIGDTVNNDYSLTDEEIQRHLDRVSDVMAAAVRCQEDRIARAVVKTAISASGLTSQRVSIVDLMERHLKLLKKQMGKGKLHSYVGGISQSRIDSQKSDSDFPEPAFSVGRDDFPGAAGYYDEDEDDTP